MNLPNSLTVARIVLAPVVGLLPFMDSWQWRMAAFWLFVAVAVTDYFDGMLARSRNLVTNLGKLLDPLADKLLLLATFVPMYLLQRPAPLPPWLLGMKLLADAPALTPASGSLAYGMSAGAVFPFVLPGFRAWPLPLAVVLVILGRELFMTVFRQLAARRGVVIAAIGPAKWKTGFQWTWAGSAFFWFAAITAAVRYQWLGHPLWRAFAFFNGVVGALTMTVAFVLTVFSLWLYLRRYGDVLFGK